MNDFTDLTAYDDHSLAQAYTDAATGVISALNRATDLATHHGDHDTAARLQDHKHRVWDQQYALEVDRDTRIERCTLWARQREDICALIQRYPEGTGV